MRGTGGSDLGGVREAGGGGMDSLDWMDGEGRMAGRHPAPRHAAAPSDQTMMSMAAIRSIGSIRIIRIIRTIRSIRPPLT